MWREGLLAQAVLRHATKGYRHHPQLARFRAQAFPIASIAQYLWEVHAESVTRGYRFDATRITAAGIAGQIDVPRGQIGFEWRHLQKKLERRVPEWLTQSPPRVHPLFRVIPGGVAEWERG